MTAVSLKSLYVQQTHLPDAYFSGDDIVPTTVFNALTRCNAVKAAALQALSNAVRENYAEKNELMVMMRQTVASSLESEQLTCPDGYDKKMVAQLLLKLLEVKRESPVLRIGPRLCYRKGFRQVLTGSGDVLFKEGNTIVFIKLSKAKKDDIDELGVLLYVLLVFNEYPHSEQVIYRRVPVVEGGAEVEYTLEKKDLVEPVKTTINKILTSIKTDIRDKGPNCAQCIHASYCPVLKEELKEAVEEAVDADS